MIMTATSWQQRYDAVLSVSDADANADSAHTVVTLDRAVAAFVDELLAAEATAEGLAAIGRELLVAFDDVSASAGKLQRNEKLRLLQLQAVCRLLCCIDDDAVAMEQTALSASVEKMKGKQKETTKKKKSKKSKKVDKSSMTVREELRALLDRIALLLDATNPPSINEDEAELSPFHSFLVDGLERRLSRFNSALFKHLRETYEIEDNDQVEVVSATAIRPKVRMPSPTKPQATYHADTGCLVNRQHFRRNPRCWRPMAAFSLLSKTRDPYESARAQT
ncbi:hypothetical protein PINS_up001981 [Pythium insidiosum]|nr:hypothetical protein PINS_up001981 [Pythium insidiosum]